MKPFDNVTVTITKDDIDYVYGGTILATWTDADGNDMCAVSLLNSDGVVNMLQSECTAL